MSGNDHAPRPSDPSKSDQDTPRSSKPERSSSSTSSRSYIPQKSSSSISSRSTTPLNSYGSKTKAEVPSKKPSNDTRTDSSTNVSTKSSTTIAPAAKKVEFKFLFYPHFFRHAVTVQNMSRELDFQEVLVKWRIPWVVACPAPQPTDWPSDALQEAETLHKAVLLFSQLIVNQGYAGVQLETPKLTAEHSLVIESLYRVEILLRWLKRRGSSPNWDPNHIPSSDSWIHLTREKINVIYIREYHWVEKYGSQDYDDFTLMWIWAKAPILILYDDIEKQDWFIQLKEQGCKLDPAGAYLFKYGLVGAYEATLKSGIIEAGKPVASATTLPKLIFETQAPKDNGGELTKGTEKEKLNG